MRFFWGVILAALILFSSASALAAPDVDLNVPFVVQAPFGDWSWPWKDFCEEASVVMAYSYVKDERPSNLQAALLMLRIAIFELQVLGYEKDTNIADTERILKEFYGYEKTRTIENPSIADIEREIRGGSLVIIPAAGALLKNPKFTTAPRYHMVVAKGFDKNNFIVHEPGTRFGADYVYEKNLLMGAMHDLVPEGDIKNGKKVVLVVERDLPSASLPREPRPSLNALLSLIKLVK